MINLFTAYLLGAIVLNLLLGLFVLLTNVRRLTNRVFAVLSLCGGLWFACQFLGSTTHSEARLIFWIRQSCAVSAFIPPLFYMLRNAVLTAAIGPSRWKMRAWVALAGAVAILCQSRYFLTGVRMAATEYELAEPIYGGGFALFVAYWLAAVVFLIASFFRALSKARGVSRVELQFMSLGSFLCLIPGVFLVLIVPLWTRDSQSARFTPMAAVLWNGIIAYGIVTRRIMSITEFLGRALANLLLVLFLALVYFLVYRFFNVILPARYAGSGAVPHILAAVVMAIGLAPTRTFLQDRTSRLFSRRQDRMTALVRQVGLLTRSVTTLDALLGRFSRLLVEALEPENLRIYLHENGRYVLRQEMGAPIGPACIEKASPLTDLLRARDYPMARDMLRRFGRGSMDVQCERALDAVGAEAVMVFRDKSGMSGFALVGRLANGQSFGAREIDLLAVLGNQLGVAMENARLYTSLQDAGIYNEVLLDNLVSGVVAMDPGERITVCNREARRLLGLDGASDPIGRPAEAVLPAPFLGALRASLASGQGVRDMDAVLRPSSDDEQPLRYATAVFGSQGAVLGALMVLQDISAIRRLEAQIRRGDRLSCIGTLAAGMAHEIKNPLVCLKTFVQLLPEHLDDPDFRATFIPLLGKEVDRIDVIVNQLLDFSHPVKAMRVPMSLHAVLDDALQLISQPSKARGIVLDRRYAAGDDRLLGDRRLLGQVFVNLFLNGIEAMDTGGTLTVSTRPSERPWPAGRTGLPPTRAWIEVRVRDTGRGIAESDQSRVFDPFFTTKANGTGLGLSVSHSIVVDHQGAIDVESVPGQGACFRVLLPLLPAEGAGEAAKGEA